MQKSETPPRLLPLEETQRQKAESGFDPAVEEHCCKNLWHTRWDWHFQGERSPVRRWLVLPVGAAELVIFISSLGAGVHTLTQPPRSCRAPVGRQYLRDNRWTFLLATSVHTIRYVLRFHPEEEQKNSKVF